MTTTFTFLSANGHGRKADWTIALAAVLIALSAPVAACERAASKWIAGAESPPQSIATFTGEFVNGAPVYRLPSITVISRGSSPASAGPALPALKRKVANASPEAVAVKPCAG
jgi:hypothetical protein